jgi:hypothetical protein
MKSKILMTSAMGSVFALSAFTPIVTHAFGDGTCGAGMMKLQMVDKNKDNKISEEEMMTHMQKMFDNMDTDDSGTISPTEWLFAGHPEVR